MQGLEGLGLQGCAGRVEERRELPEAPGEGAQAAGSVESGLLEANSN